MEQARLREYENLCIQEEPPFCQAACPLHVDARGVCQALGQGKVDGALKLLLGAMPLPRLMTRLCEEPCKKACKRADRGGSLEMRELERFCVEKGKMPRPALVPPGGKNIALVGLGVSVLTAAWDLCRRGHAATVFPWPRPGGEDLKARAAKDAGIQEALDFELEELKKMKVTFAADAVSPEELTERYDRVYAGLDDNPALPFVFDPVTFATPTPRLFAGGNAATFIDRASQGRRAAQSILRDLQGASLTAVRGREGVFETRLYTNTDGVADLAPVRGSPEEEAKRCLNCQCLECVKVCTYLRTYGGWPRRYAREIYNNLSVVQGSRTANKMINSCTNCGLCAAVCPNGFDMGALCAEARREMTRQGKMPLSAHEFALRDMEHAAAVAGSGPFAVTPGSGRVFFPGCQMTASDPELTVRVLNFLRENAGVTSIWTDCCGSPARWAGREDLFATQTRELTERWQAAGSPELILACSACLQVFRTNPAFHSKITPLWELLKDRDFSRNQTRAAPFRFYRPCTLRGDPSLAGLVRKLALGVTDLENAEEPGSEEDTLCCGYGGLQYCANPELADAMTREAAAQSDADILVACAMCRDRFAAAGRRSAHLLDLMFPPRDGFDPASRSAPRWTERRDNRERLRRMLIQELGQTDIEFRKSGECGMELKMSVTVRERLNRRRILDDELRAVVRAAEKSGIGAVSPDGVTVACVKLRNVTTWVEYVREGQAVVVRNAWTHRMVLEGVAETEEAP